MGSWLRESPQHARAGTEGFLEEEGKLILDERREHREPRQ